MNMRNLKGYQDRLQAFQRLIDLLLVVLTHGIICRARGLAWNREMANITVVACVSYGLIAESMGLYRTRQTDHLIVVLKSILEAWAMTASAVALFLFATKTSTQVSRIVSFAWILITPITLIASRVMRRAILRARWATGRGLRMATILGITPSAERLCAEIRQRPWLGLKITGIYDDRAEDRRHSFVKQSCRHLGGTDDLVQACRAGRIDVVYVALPLRAEERIGNVLRALANSTATVYLVADLPSYDLLSARWTALGNSPLVSIHDTPFLGASGWLKRLEDVVIGLGIVFLISIPLLVISVLVKATSSGPVFFRQLRYGLNGRAIRALKFRTMTVCEDGPHIIQARKSDGRVTPLGRFLRRTSLDELPQFLQVLTGEMSIVGPRPHAVAHNEQYRSLIPFYMLRHKVKPGITGWAQVNGWRGETPTVDLMERRVAHDLEYINNWSFLLDLKIIFLTIVGRKKNRNAW
jgi:putative colanic acid biosynthesis UDP-glucose lipid carrier transferase